MKFIKILIFFAFLPAGLGLCQTDAVLNNHKVVLDAQKKILPWVVPQDRAFDKVIRLAWNFLLKKTLVESNGLKSYFTHCCVDQKTFMGTEWPHNPAGLYAMFTDSALAYYAYSGDISVINLARETLDYQLKHGTTPSDWEWAKVPYSSSHYGDKEYRGGYDFLYDPKLPGRGDGYGVVEPDKIGELGFGYLKFYEFSGEPKYKKAAIACADALAKHIRKGDKIKSPWPFRVYAETGRIREEYTSNVLGPVKLLDELMRLKIGDAVLYKKTRDAAWAWLMEYPMKNNLWSAYFEDVVVYEKPENFNQITPLETIRYIMEHPEYDPDWEKHVPAVIKWVEKIFAGDTDKEKGAQWGANAISEQIHYMYKMGSHTARYASVNVLWHEKNGDETAKEKAFRSFAWATYSCKENGIVNLGPVEQQVWFSDGYGDYVKHFLAGMASAPEWSPSGENHLLRSSSVITKVTYISGGISYETFYADSEEILRVNFKPAVVTAGNKGLEKRNDTEKPGWVYDEKSGVLKIRHAGAKNIKITAG